MKIPTLKDSRGGESTTLLFVSISWAVVVLRFALGGLTIDGYIAVETISATDFGAAVAMILGIWLGREWRATR